MFIDLSSREGWEISGHRVWISGSHTLLFAEGNKFVTQRKRIGYWTYLRICWNGIFPHWSDVSSCWVQTTRKGKFMCKRNWEHEKERWQVCFSSLSKSVSDQSDVKTVLFQALMNDLKRKICFLLSQCTRVYKCTRVRKRRIFPGLEIGILFERQNGRNVNMGSSVISQEGKKGRLFDTCQKV